MLSAKRLGSMAPLSSFLAVFFPHFMEPSPLKASHTLKRFETIICLRQPSRTHGYSITLALRCFHSVSTGGQPGPLAIKGPATGTAGTPASTPQTVISVVTTPSPSAAAAASLGSSGSSAIPVVSSRSGGGGGGLSTGAIVGIVIGIIAGVIILAAVAILVVSRVTKHRRESVRAKSFQRFASMDAEPV
jgi:hypothetical protein